MSGASVVNTAVPVETGKGQANTEYRPSSDHREKFLEASGATSPAPSPLINSPSQDQANSFVQRISDLRASQIRVRLSAALTVDTSQNDALLEQVSNLLVDRGRVSINLAQNPNALLEYRLSTDLELAPELRRSNLTGIGAYQMQAVTQNDGQIRICLRDFSRPESPIIWEKKLNPSETKSPMSQDILAAVAGEIEGAIACELPNSQRRLDALPTAGTVHPPSVTLSPDRKLSDEQKEALRKFTAEMGFDISLTFCPEGHEIDTTIASLGPLAKDAFEVKPAIVEAAIDSGRALSLRGQVRRIELDRYPSADESKAVRNSSGDVLLYDGHPLVEEKVDKYGNTIVRALSLGKSAGDLRMHEMIAILPRNPYQTEARPGIVPFKVDLSAFGYGELPAFLEQREIPRIESSHALNIYSNIPAERAKAELLPKLSELRHGIRDAEDFFGLHKGNGVRELYYADSQRENAFFSRKDPHTVTLQDEIIKADNIPARNVGFHETVHLIDGATRFQLSGGALESLYKQLSHENSALFNFIDEKHFLPGASFGGHSAENSAEFLASLMNSLYLADRDISAWRKAFNKGDASQRADYVRALQAVQNNLAAIRISTPGVLPDTRRLERVMHRILSAET